METERSIFRLARRQGGLGLGYDERPLGRNALSLPMR